MKSLALLLPVAVGTAVVISTPPAEPTGWKTTQISRYFWGEGASGADVNTDGHMDVLSGPYWYQGPDFKQSHAIIDHKAEFVTKGADGKETTYPGFAGALGNKNAYSDAFLTATHDFNGDGWTDYMIMGWPGRETIWYENPGKKDVTWAAHVALASTDNESPRLTDIDGDGQPDLLAMSGGQVGYATYDAKKPTEAWTWRPVSHKDPKGYFRYTHGLGAADINGDGRTDILEKKGWWEQPKGDVTPWEFHEAPFCGPDGGAQMYGYDVNADGRMDVVTSLEAHKFGIAWIEQKEDGSWERHLLTDTPTEKGSTGVAFSQPHAVELADMNGDGLMDIVTGKRFWAHGPKGDPEPGQAPVIYAFLLSRDGGKVSYTPQIIHADSGVGCQFSVVDLNGDKKPDVVTANKKGVYVHLQQGGK